MTPAAVGLVFLLNPAVPHETGPVQGIALYARGNFYCSYDYIGFRADGTVVRERERCSDAKKHGAPGTAYCEIREGHTTDFANLSQWVVATVQEAQPQPQPAPQSSRTVRSTSSPGSVLTIERNGKTSSRRLADDFREWAIERVVHSVLADVEWRAASRTEVCPSMRRE